MEVVLSQYIGYNLKADDGLIGTVCDFCFDHRSWRVRHLVIDTNDDDSEIFVSPGVLLEPDVESRIIPIKISRRQIYLTVRADNDLAIVESQVSEQRNYYTTNQVSASTLPVMKIKRDCMQVIWGDDSNYKRTQVVAGSIIRTVDLVLGKVFDYIIEDTNWQIRYVVIQVEKLITQKYILIDCSNLRNMCWSEGVAELKL